MQSPKSKLHRNSFLLQLNLVEQSISPLRNFSSWRYILGISAAVFSLSTVNISFEFVIVFLFVYLCLYILEFVFVFVFTIVLFCKSRVSRAGCLPLNSKHFFCVFDLLHCHESGTKHWNLNETRSWEGGESLLLQPPPCHGLALVTRLMSWDPAMTTPFQDRSPRIMTKIA